MSCSRLVIVEGIPGSGKTSSAHFVADWFRQNGRGVRLYLEGDLDHPADFESVARLSVEEFQKLLANFPQAGESLWEQAREEDGEVFVSYRKLLAPSPALLQALADRDVYEQPLADWQRLTLARWQRFAAASQAAECCDTYIFECCLLQNLLTTPLARFDQPEDEAVAHVLNAARFLKPLCPALIYLDPPSIYNALDTVAGVRPREWLDYVIAYTAGQAWGSARGLRGFDGMVRFYEARRRLEIGMFPELQQLGFHILWVNNAGRNWEHDYSRIRSFLYDICPPN